MDRCGRGGKQGQKLRWGAADQPSPISPRQHELGLRVAAIWLPAMPESRWTRGHVGARFRASSPDQRAWVPALPTHAPRDSDEGRRSMPQAAATFEIG